MPLTNTPEFQQMVEVLKQSPMWDSKYKDEIETMRQREKERLARQEEEAREAREAERIRNEKWHQENVALRKKLVGHKKTKAAKVPGIDRKISSARPVRTVKQKKEDKHKDGLGKALNKYADAVSIRMADKVKVLNVERSNVESMYRDEFRTPALQKNVKLPKAENLPLSFLRGFTVWEGKAVEADREFFRDFTSEDTTRRWRHMDRMVDELINVKIHPEMLNRSYLLKYCGEYKVLCEHLEDMRKLMSDSGNRRFFDSLDEKRKKKLRNAMDQNGPYWLFSQAFQSTMNARAVNMRVGMVSLDNNYGWGERQKVAEKVERFQQSLR